MDWFHASMLQAAFIMVCIALSGNSVTVFSKDHRALNISVSRLTPLIWVGSWGFSTYLASWSPVSHQKLFICLKARSMYSITSEIMVKAYSSSSEVQLQFFQQFFRCYHCQEMVHSQAKEYLGFKWKKYSEIEYDYSNELLCLSGAHIWSILVSCRAIDSVRSWVLPNFLHTLHSVIVTLVISSAFTLDWILWLIHDRFEAGSKWFWSLKHTGRCPLPYLSVVQS